MYAAFLPLGIILRIKEGLGEVHDFSVPFLALILLLQQQESNPTCKTCCSHSQSSVLGTWQHRE